ncbi:hypothetical protein ABC345_19945 [Shouchella sp. 1P09AA]|uniref:spr1630 family ClpXP-sensitive toxin n=1 Tax=unclassified Shouchella TaxID=2893065 RepID=UPI00399EF295
MKEYKFNEKLNQKIVDGILKGYKDYLKERKEKNEIMHVSSAYAWVKGNHIDHNTAEACKSEGVTFKKEKAGYTWGYLQFVDEKSIFIIKSGNRKTKYIKTLDQDNYLVKLSKINSHINFPGESEQASLFQEDLTIIDENAGLSLSNEEVEVLRSQYDRFYIVSYSLDDAKMIKEITLGMPIPETDRSFLINDLTSYIDKSTVKIDSADLSAVENDVPEELSGHSFGFKLISEKGAGNE